jgi:protein SCO1/2
MISRRSLLHSIPALGVATLVPAIPATFGTTKDLRPYGLPDLPVVTHDGKRVRFYSDLIHGKIVLINFMYSTCKGICPGMTTNLKDVYRALGDRVGRDVFMYSITLQPEKDTAERLRSYVKARGIGDGWYFLTGEAFDLDQIRKRLGFYDPNPEVDEDRTQHTGMLRVGNDARQRWTMCPALAEPSAIVRSVSWM